MRKRLFLGLVLTFFIGGFAIAGSADLTGSWSGEVTSIVCCPDGDDDAVCTTIIIQATAHMEQDGNLFHGTFEAEDYTHPCWGFIEGQEAVLTGTISTDNRIYGVVGIPDGIPDVFYIQGIGIFEGKWSGKKMNAVLRDFSDGSTTIGVFTKE